MPHMRPPALSPGGAQTGSTDSARQRIRRGAPIMSDFIESIGFAAVGCFIAILIGRLVAGRFTLRIAGTSVVTDMAAVCWSRDHVAGDPRLITTGRRKREGPANRMDAAADRLS